MRNLLLISTIFFSLCCNAQVSDRLRYFQIGFGTNHISLQDKVFSPLVYRGSGFLFNADYHNQKARRTHHINFGISSQELLPKLNPQGSGRVENTNLYLNYEYLRILSPGRTHNLGIGFYNFLSARNFIFLVEDDISIDLFTSMNLVYSYSYSLKNKHHVGLKISLPVMGYIVGRMRVPNDLTEEVFQSIVTDPNKTPTSEILASGDLLTLSKFFDLRIRLEYLFDLSERIGVGFRYLFQYYTYPKFETVSYGASQYVFRWTYKF